MPLEAPISTKWHKAGVYRWGRRVLLAFLAAATAGMASATGPHIPAPGEAAIVRKAQDQVFRMHHEAAEVTLKQGLPKSSPALHYFAGLACVTRFLDVGDTLALRRAETYWEALSPRGAPSPAFRHVDERTLKLYRGLTGVQLSYAASLRGQHIRATAYALAARKLLEETGETGQNKTNSQGLPPEAKASLMLFDYYRGRFFDKIPFVGATDFDTDAFERAAEATPTFRNMLLGSLFWIHLDQSRYAAAEEIADDLLLRYPGNRLVRQMRGAALYRGGKLEAAQDVFESLKVEYAALPASPVQLPLGYYRNVGNLARVKRAAGDEAGTVVLIGEWRRAEQAGLMPWLPQVLRRELARR
jgi:hypothetical protein